MFSNSTKYALKTVLFLAVNSSEEKKIMVKSISEPINVPQAYIAKLLQQLVKENIVSSTRGPNGGFYLTDANKKHSIMNIIEAINRGDKFNTCMLSLKECDMNNPCPLHEIASPPKSILIENLNGKTIEELALNVKTGKAFLPL